MHKFFRHLTDEIRAGQHERNKILNNEFFPCCSRVCCECRMSISSLE